VKLKFQRHVVNRWHIKANCFTVSIAEQKAREFARKVSRNIISGVANTPLRAIFLSFLYAQRQKLQQFAGASVEAADQIAMTDQLIARIRALLE